MFSPKGAAFLYVRREIQNLIQPLIVSWGAYPTPESETGSRFIDVLQWTGTKDPTAALTVPAAIRFMKHHDWIQVRCQCHNLLRQTIEQLCDLTNLSQQFISISIQGYNTEQDTDALVGALRAFLPEVVSG